MTAHYAEPVCCVASSPAYPASAIPTSTMLSEWLSKTPLRTSVLLILTSGNSRLQSIHKAKSLTSIMPLLKSHLNEDNPDHPYLKVPNLPSNFVLFSDMF